MNRYEKKHATEGEKLNVPEVEEKIEKKRSEKHEEAEW